MLKIRLQRVGRKHDPTFRVVLTDSRNSTKSGKFLEVLGSYDPRGERGAQGLKKERITHLISKGAQVTGSINNLLITKGIISGEKIDVGNKKKKTDGAEIKEPQQAHNKKTTEVENTPPQEKKEAAKENLVTPKE